MRRTIWVGNVLAEEELAGGVGHVNRRTRDLASGYASLLRAFADDGDLIAVPGDLDPQRIPLDPRLPSVDWIGLDPLRRTSALRHPETRVMKWMEVEALPDDDLPDEDDGAKLSECALGAWTWRRADAGAAEACHHRKFALSLAVGFGVALPGSRWVMGRHRTDDCADKIDAVVAEFAKLPWDRVVLKTPMSAAGRGRRVVLIDELRSAATRAWIVRGVSRFAGIIVEPWCDRVADFGICVMVLDRRSEVVSIHEQLIDERSGRFLGIRVSADRTTPATLPAAHRAKLIDVAIAAADVARINGYRGPIGIDAFSHRVGDEVWFHPLCEINARFTMGWIARAFADRLLGPNRGGTMKMGQQTASSRGDEDVDLLLPDPKNGAPGVVFQPEARREEALVSGSGAA